MANINFPVGVEVSMRSFRLTNSTSFAVSCSTRPSKSRVFLAKRLMASTVTVSPGFTTAINAFNCGRLVSLPLNLSMYICSGGIPISRIAMICLSKF